MNGWNQNPGVRVNAAVHEKIFSLTRTHGYLSPKDVHTIKFCLGRELCCKQYVIEDFFFFLCIWKQKNKSHTVDDVDSTGPLCHFVTVTECGLTQALLSSLER